MGPRVAGDLVTLGNHALNGANVGGVDHTLANVVTSDEPCCNSTVSLESIQHAIGVEVRAIVVSDGDITVVDAVVDANTAIGNVTTLGSGVVRSIGAAWFLVAVASRAVADLTIGRVAVGRAFTTPSRSRTAVARVASSEFRTTLRSISDRDSGGQGLCQAGCLSGFEGACSVSAGFEWH